MGLSHLECQIDLCYLNLQNLTRGLITEGFAVLRKLSSDYCDQTVENFSDKEMLIEDSLVAASSGFQNTENVDSRPGRAKCPKSMEKEKCYNDYSNFFTEFKIY
ncbi:hypothetical protein NPIL_47641 [Nephila pilipes]|uniref:Uncharacterized protein n=1 Tax=Nephila pilipes TaxID=299642 RepID=A0A8X6PAK3_NEPPI|nr:hypothetical protein NPIL_47641 [Nephila pilipes]